MNLGRCKDCRQPIRWTRTPKGKHLAIDVEPDARGNVVIHHTDPDGREHVRVLKKDETYVGLHFMPHRATCEALKQQETA